ncbi:MAG TPA: low temperature requirement protein A [Acidimicrobiales bacterium]|nr:low temperature requirement protein A [Acidimicrobiales bacterium]
MRVHLRMAPRDPAERHRSSTPLEAFFDLTFVVAVAQAGLVLRDGLADGQAGRVLVGYPFVFFGIWWAWMNFSWFASAYDIDDVVYRVAVLVQIAGVLTLAVGVPRALERRDFALMLVGYLVMRLAMVGLWLRAALSNAEGRACALRYAGGITAVQAGWVIWLLEVPKVAALWVFLPLAAAEMAVPLFAEAAGRTAWHPGHIAERYGLFTIIVLGEAVSAGTVAVSAAVEGGASFERLAAVVAGGLLVVFSMWWLYFDMPSEEIVRAVRRSFATRLSGAFAWGYGHYVIFASIAATGAGLAVAVESATHRIALTHLEAGFALTAPVALYLLAVWALHAPYKPAGWLRSFGGPAGAGLVLASSAAPQTALVSGAVLAALVAAGTASRREAPRSEPAGGAPTPERPERPEHTPERPEHTPERSEHTPERTAARAPATADSDVRRRC